MDEVERKFFLKNMPSKPYLDEYSSTRHFLEKSTNIEERITIVKNTYYYDRKKTLSNLSRERIRRVISEEEFNNLSNRIKYTIKRKTVVVSVKPKISIHKYLGKYKGLVKVEVQFSTEEEAKNFKPLNWMGKEITGSIISRDSDLLKMDEDLVNSWVVA